ncbi:MBOAT family O-acyltransferase [Gynuella sunshinyii]|uniref:Probable alginate O-acetylase n=1 Tax=Gynuella sunshinyii YC6258 TaxID=1445510 RepID=A0A0C5VRX1_9GAMM|nr:MBOAT family protein [Gynuella sunshinyii]AJQ93019.1 putative membrane protein involved in D-alanine export [Gynuella sunshinyii YC6258]
MVFSSSIFLFLFLPLFLLVYYLTPGRWKSLTILLGSYAFYAWWRVDFLLLFVAVTGWNYQMGIRIARALSQQQNHLARRWLVLGISGDLATLGYFKYANFGVDSLNALLTSTGIEPFAVTQIVLPIGISFYVFQAISYVIDVYRRDVEATQGFIDFAAFIALFPQLIAGPVLRYKDLADQFRYRQHNFALFSEGISRFMRGFIKKVFIADAIAPLADQLFLLDQPSGADAWLGAMAYTAQLYFDFSGYSDMAIGLGLMMGFRFVENFNQPYISQSITEFWRRWHISLSTWLRDYLYVPLGGNRHGTFRTYRNLFLTMLLGGLWHGANWTFVIWGGWHGMWLAIERATGLGRSTKRFNLFRWCFTLVLVILGWVMFRAASAGDAWRIYTAMFSMDWHFSEWYRQQVSQLQITMLILAWALILVNGFRADGRLAALSGSGWTRYVTTGLLVPIFALAILKLVADSYSPFLYFQF